MKIFLARPDAAFYHITRRSDWENGIQERGLLADKDGQIFVSRSADEGILASIAINQLLELDEEPDLVVLKLTQTANQFQFEEFSFDKQSNETTFPFHNIIRRPHIPLEHIELERHIQMPLTELGLIADQSDLRLPNSPIFEEALQVIYEMPNRLRYRLAAEMDTDGTLRFSKQFAW